MPQPPVEALNHPWVVYASIIVIIAGFVVTVSKRIQEALGPLGRWISARRERAIERERERVVALGRLDDVVAEQLRADIRDIAAQMNAQRERHNNEIRRIREEQSGEIAQIRSEHSREIAAVRNELRREHDVEIAEIRRAHRAEMAELRRQLNGGGEG